MQFQYTPYILPLVAAAVISGVLALYAWRRRATRGATALALLTLAAAEWSLGYALEIAGADLFTKVFWGKSQYFGIATVPLVWLAFALQYTDHEKWLTRRNVVILAILPVITLLLALTTDVHGLIWKEFHLDPSGPFLALVIAYGLGFWVYWIYAQLLVLTGAVLVIWTQVRMSGVYRRQAVVLVAAALAPLVGNALYGAGLNPVRHLDLTPFAFTFSAAAIAWGIFQFRLIDLAPLARDTVIESMGDGMIVLDAQGRLADLNPAAQRMIGMTASEVIGCRVEEVFGAWPDLVERDRNVRGAHHEIAFGTGEARHFYELRRSPLRERPGYETGQVVTLSDITERKRIEETLQHHTEYLAALHETTLALMERPGLADLLEAIVRRASHLLDTPHGYLYLVNAEASILEFKIGLGLFTSMLDLRLKPDEGLSGKVWQSGEPLVVNEYDAWEGRSLNVGRRLIRAVVGVPLHARGQVAGVLGVAYGFDSTRLFGPRDVDILIHFARLASLALDNASLYDAALREIGERKQAEARLQDSEARYRQIVETASDIIYRTDAQGRLTYVNPTGLRTMGFAAEADVLGRHYLEFVHPDWRHKLKRLYDQQFVAQEWNTYQEFLSLAADGRVVWIGQNVQILKEGERVVGFQAVARDITQRKQADEVLAHARDQALEASRLKSQLLAKVSHELRTPLGAILGYAELLEAGTFGPLSEQQRRVAAKIVDSTHYLSGLVNDLLDQAQYESGKVILRISSFSLKEMAQRVEARMGVLAQGKGLTLTFEIAPEAPDLISGDEPRLQQILVNLVGNAIKFTQAGAVQVRLFGPDPKHWAMQVSDTGPGVPKEAQAYIFEPFRQVDGSMMREHRGTGLGLSIVKQLTDLMGGAIMLESEVGQGSTFTVVLPLVQTPEAIP